MIPVLNIERESSFFKPHWCLWFIAVVDVAVNLSCFSSSMDVQLRLILSRYFSTYGEYDYKNNLSIPMWALRSKDVYVEIDTKSGKAIEIIHKSRLKEKVTSNKDITEKEAKEVIASMARKVLGAILKQFTFRVLESTDIICTFSWDLRNANVSIFKSSDQEIWRDTGT